MKIGIGESVEISEDLHLENLSSLRIIQPHEQYALEAEFKESDKVISFTIYLDSVSARAYWKDEKKNGK
jgi:hypothetical protein